MHLDSEDDPLVRSVDVVDDQDWSKTAFDIDAAGGEVLREQVDKDRPPRTVRAPGRTPGARTGARRVTGRLARYRNPFLGHVLGAVVAPAA
ncbi:hypothetical protein [Streptomyces wuyuanensis]|uniref:hypothetical protein n=1 Tax=Streptomyces wuyuanensis TaxID=1196353 RepID=UPI003D74A761